MSQSPNSEQQLAINSLEGALLSAGAGSGKTFVIVHHILFLFEKILNEEMNKVEIDYEQREKNIARKVSEIVVMTFTRKAAGELRARIKKELNTLAIGSDETAKKWQLIKKYNEYLTIGTIDSFCSKVLKSGIISRVDNKFEIIDQVKRDWELERVLKRELGEVVEKNSNLAELALKRYASISTCFHDIFKDSVTRWTWEKNYQKSLSDLLDTDIQKRILEHYHCGDFWKQSWPEDLFDDYSDKKWFSAMAGIETLKQTQANLFDVETFQKVLEFLKSIERFTPPRAKKTPVEVINFCQLFKRFRECLVKKFGEDFLATASQLQEPQSELNKWWNLLQLLFPRVLKKYEKLDGMTFSDLNITLLKSLSNEEIRQKIAEKYKYFIVDEFQDTSMIQYQIIKKIISSNFSKLFAVGDRKQAIYGFRGGELDVFNQCEQETNFNHSLLNNYRSSFEITEFNNILFKNIMGLGPKFEKIDKHSVVFEGQNTPDITVDQKAGQITYLRVTEPDFWDFKNDYVLSQLEAELFIDKIKRQPSDKNIAILYSKIKLSYDLIERLISNSLSFTAQVNLSLDEEPILELLKSLLSRQKMEQEIDKEERNRRVRADSYFLLIYQTILSRLNITTRITADEAYAIFLKEKKFWGVKLGFYKVLIQIGLSFSKIEFNLKVFERMLIECNQDEDQLLAMLKLRNQGRYSLDLMLGDTPDRICIMTSHASKGLEFDTVLLGGIYANGRSQADREMVGKEPGSFKWFKGSVNQKKYRTPILIEENFLKKEKEFSESKRLFYVACTRAKRELVWCDFPVEKLSFQDNAWFKPLNIVKEQIAHLVKIESTDIDGSVLEKKNIFKRSELPLFHRDNIGISSRAGENKLDFAILPEISVTKLSSIAICPRKFYLGEILKIDYKGLLNFGRAPDDNKKEKISGLERGTLLHKEVENFLLGKATSKTELTSWLDKQLEKFPKDSWTYLIEKLHKFDLYGYMMTGIPDLIMLNDKTLSIWDFKSGNIDEAKEQAYWFQLMLYTWPYKDQFTSIDLSIVYLDEKKILTRSINKPELLETIDNNLAKVKDLFEKNEQSCQDCLYQNLCKSPEKG